MKTIKKIIVQVSGAILTVGLVLSFGGCLNDVPVAPEAKSKHKILVWGKGTNKIRP